MYSPSAVYEKVKGNSYQKITPGIKFRNFFHTMVLIYSLSFLINFLFHKPHKSNFLVIPHWTEAVSASEVYLCSPDFMLQQSIRNIQLRQYQLALSHRSHQQA